MIDKELEIKITDYVENNMSSERKKEFENFLEMNVNLKVEVGQLKSMISDLKNVHKIKLDTSFDERLKSSIENYDNKKKNTLSIFRLFENPIYASLGAVAAILLVVIVTLSNPVYMPNNGSMAIDSNEAYEEDAFVDDDSNSYEKFDDKNENQYDINRTFDLQRVEDSNDN
tara:strand:+ start:1534 stop:2046 length:513 start_codon:yes stop_codon:yes gene_type:complete